MHPTYKHLEDRIRLGSLTLGQWTQLVACALAAYLLSIALPLPGSWSMSVAVTVCGIPAAGAIAFMSEDFDVTGWVGAVVRWKRGPKLFTGSRLGGDGVRPRGDVAPQSSPAEFDPERLWD